MKKHLFFLLLLLFPLSNQLLASQSTAKTTLPKHICGFVFKENILHNLQNPDHRAYIKKVYVHNAQSDEYTLRSIGPKEKTKAAHILSISGFFNKKTPMTHHMMLLVIQIGVIIFAAKLGGTFFDKVLRMPAVLGELFAGIVIGAHCLGGITIPGLGHGLFHTVGNFPVTAELYGIATVASIILLFLAGLETDFAMFIRFSFAGSIVGIGGVLVSFLLGDLTAVILSSMISSEPIGFMHPIALFLGTISTATSVGITARILSEKRKMDSPEGVSILAGAVIDDVLGIIILAIVLGISKVFISSASGTDLNAIGLSSINGVSSVLKTGGINWGKIGVIAIKAIGFWLGTTALGMLFANKISRFLKNFRHSMMSAMALGLALVLAGLSEMAGLAMIIGAYIMGLSLSKTDIAHELQERLAPLYHFFVPVFFTVMGMLVDFTAFSSTSIILFGLIYSVIAIVAKLLGSSLPSLLLGYNLRGAIRIGLGMVPRGEVALIVAGIGLSAGIIPPSIFGIAIMMTLITTMMAPPALIWAFKSPKRGTKKAISTADSEIDTVTLDFSNDQTTQLLAENLATTFREEEFFVHIIDMSNMVYSIRKDEIAVTMCQAKNNIEISFHKKDMHYIKFIISESIINLVSLIEEVKDASELKGKPQELLTF